MEKIEEGPMKGLAKEIDPKTLKLRVPLTFTVARVSKLAPALTPDVLQGLKPNQRAVNIRDVVQITLKTGHDVGEFVNSLGNGEYVFSGQHGVPPLTIQLLMLIAGNVIGYDKIDAETGEVIEKNDSVEGLSGLADGMTN